MMFPDFWVLGWLVALRAAMRLLLAYRLICTSFDIT